MTYLCLRTDRPEAELAIYTDDQLVASERWLADRQLAETIHLKLRALLKSVSLDLESIDGLVIFKGPGSFTGLRIGFSTANALAYALNIQIVAEGGTNWQMTGLSRLKASKGEKLVLPEYGRPPHITKPRK